IGQVEFLEYDQDGNRTASIDAEGRRTEHTYDGLSRETDRRLPQVNGDPRTQAWTHTIHGEALTETDPRGATTTHAYDALGRRVSTTSPATASAPQGHVRSWTYDPNGNVLSTTDTN